MTTLSEFASWFALATDTTRPLLERQLAASNVVAAADALAAAVKAEEKEQRERDGLPRLALLPAMTVERNAEAKRAFDAAMGRGEGQS